MTTEVFVRGSGHRHLVKVTKGDDVVSETETVLGVDHSVWISDGEVCIVSELEGVLGADAPPAPATTIEHDDIGKVD